MSIKSLLQTDPVSWLEILKAAGPWSIPLAVTAFIWKMIGGAQESVNERQDKAYERQMKRLGEREDTIDRREAEFDAKEAAWAEKELGYLAEIRRLSGLNGGKHKD